MARNEHLRRGISTLQSFCQSGPLRDRLAGIAQRTGLPRLNETPTIQNLLLRSPDDAAVCAMPTAGIEGLDFVLDQPKSAIAESLSRQRLVVLP